MKSLRLLTTSILVYILFMTPVFSMDYEKKKQDLIQEIKVIDQELQQLQARISQLLQRKQEELLLKISTVV